eukprot:g10951.t3
MRPEKICRFGKSKGSADSDRAKFVGCAEGNFSCTMCGGPYGFARWGVFWAAAFRDAPPLPTAVRAQLPEEGGFVVRPLTQPLPASVLRVEGRCLQAPRREVHADLGFPEPALVSNEVEGVSTTIISSWSKRCKGQTSEPLLRCMGAANVSMAVKGLARARKNLSERKGVLRLFVCYPERPGEVRYGLAPSVVQRLDFEDIREGTLRLFVLPGFEGDVRVVTLVDELAAKEVLAQIHHELTGGTLQRKRLLEFLHAAAASPAAAKWPSSGEVSSGNFVESLLQRPEPEVHASIPEGALFPHQVATVAWMKRIERQGKQSLQVEPFHFAGTTLGSAYTMRLPLGGVVAHPPGSGKTRIVAALASERASLQHARPAAMELPAPGRRKAVDWLRWCPCGGSSLRPSPEVSAKTASQTSNCAEAVVTWKNMAIACRKTSKDMSRMPTFHSWEAGNQQWAERKGLTS